MKTLALRIVLQAAMVFIMIPIASAATSVTQDKTILTDLHRGHIEKIKGWQDPTSGRFYVDGAFRGLSDQGLMYPLAVAWKMAEDDFPHRRDLLMVTEKAVKALLDGIGKDGTTDLVGTDGAVWKRHHDPWLYLHMIRTYAIVREKMSPSLEQRWRQLLLEGFGRIADRELLHARPHNLHLVQAVALHKAGTVFQKPRWQNAARTYIRTVIAAQNPEGYWSEHEGPVVDYNFVYLYALGIHYAETGDEATGQALAKGAAFQYRMRYLDGTSIETVDERNYYKREPREGNIGFAFTDDGVRFVNEQYATTKYLWYYFTADLLNYQDRIDKRILAERPDRKVVSFSSDKGRIAVRHDGNWQRVVSAHVGRQSPSRWIQDRQNFLSIFHKDVGLIVGGGNTKLQPRWSTFAVGPTNLMDGRGGENPGFMAPRGLIHIPEAAEVRWSDDLGVRLKYGSQEALASTRIINDRSLQIEYARLTDSAPPMTAHVTIIPHPGRPIVPDKGRKATLGAEPFVWTPGSFGGWFEHNGVRYAVPPEATVRWPVFPYDPYRKDGRAELKNARIVIELPFTHTVRRHLVQLDVLPGAARGKRQ